jgi:hypothetical protein
MTVVPTCKTCRHPQKKQIETEFKNGASFQQLSHKWNLTWQSVRNHLVKHFGTEEDEPDELAQEINDLTQEIANARRRGDHLAVKSLLLARKDLRLAKSREVMEGDSLEARYQALIADKELYRYFLDRCVEQFELASRQ